MTFQQRFYDCRFERPWNNANKETAIYDVENDRQENINLNSRKGQSQGVRVVSGRVHGGATHTQTDRQAGRQTNRRVIQIQTDRREGHLPGGRVGT